MRCSWALSSYHFAKQMRNECGESYEEVLVAVLVATMKKSMLWGVAGKIFFLEFPAKVLCVPSPEPNGTP